MYHHPKVRAAGLEGRHLWDVLRCATAEAKSDGVITELMLKDAAYLAEVDRDAAVAVILKVGLLHDSKAIRRCDSCKARAGKLAKDEYYIHDFLDYNPAKVEVSNDHEKWILQRKRDLSKNAALCKFIQTRDGAICRYCSKTVNWSDKVGVDGGTYDHVDPNGWNTPDNVVVACRNCNSIKKRRKPEQAGMVLRPPLHPELTYIGRVTKDPSLKSEPGLESTPESTPNGDGVNSDSDQELSLAGAHARLGQGRVGAGSELAPELTPDGAGEGREGPGPGPSDFPAETQLEGESA